MVWISQSSLTTITMSTIPWSGGQRPRWGAHWPSMSLAPRPTRAVQLCGQHVSERPCLNQWELCASGETESSRIRLSSMRHYFPSPHRGRPLSSHTSMRERHLIRTLTIIIKIIFKSWTLSNMQTPAQQWTLCSVTPLGQSPFTIMPRPPSASYLPRLL